MPWTLLHCAVCSVCHVQYTLLERADMLDGYSVAVCWIIYTPGGFLMGVGAGVWVAAWGGSQLSPDVKKIPNANF